MTRIPPSQLRADADDVPASVRLLRAEHRLWQRGALLMQKLWRVHYNHDRHDTPLPFLRGKR